MPDTTPEAGSPSENGQTKTLRTLGYVLLVAAGVPTFLVGLARLIDPTLNQAGLPLAVAATIGTLLLPLVCLVAGIVYLVRGRKERGWGFVLGAVASVIVGTGACLTIATL